MIAFPLVALANHQFSDVPNSNPFHGSISTIAAAGITTGCGGGRFCPKDAVTREQMAAFLGRGLGRTTASQGNISVTGSAEDHLITSVTIRAGGTSGEVGFILLNSAATLRVQGDGTCPCTFGAGVEDVDAGFNYTTVLDDDAPYHGQADLKLGSVSQTWVVPVASGTVHTFDLVSDLFVSGPVSGSMNIWGQLTATYVPFGADGGDEL